AFYEIAESSALAIGPTEVAMQEAEGEILGQFLSEVGITQRSEQVAVDGSPIALQQGGAGGPAGVSRIVVGLANHRPQGGNLIETAGIAHFHGCRSPDA